LCCVPCLVLENSPCRFLLSLPVLLTASSTVG
jgi:hypothetical protein